MTDATRKLKETAQEVYDNYNRQKEKVEQALKLEAEREIEWRKAQVWAEYNSNKTSREKLVTTWKMYMDAGETVEAETVEMQKLYKKWLIADNRFNVSLEEDAENGKNI